MSPRHTLSPDLDKRLISYASTSFNAYEAAYGLQQMAALIPVYAMDLEAMYGKAGTGDARRAWGVVADLLSAITRATPTLGTLIDYGFTAAVEIDHLIAFGGDFSLAASPVLAGLDFRSAVLGDLGPVLMTAVAHDSVAKPLLDAFQAELHAWDADAAANSRADTDVRNFSDVMRMLPDEPERFPLWDGRPMFLDEQKALLDYIAKCVGAEIVADALVDEPLGEFLLRGSGVISASDFNGEPVLDLNLVPHNLLRRPIALICHQVGNAALNALKVLGQDADLLDRLFIVETTVRKELGIDISRALSSTRTLAVDAALRSYVVDIRDKKRTVLDPSVPVTPYEFPDLKSE